MEKEKKPYLQKTTTFKTNQMQIIRKLSHKCTPKTFVNSIDSNGATIKHFALPGGTHAYTVRPTESNMPSRLFSNVELPNITYLANHWNPSLMPDLDLSKLTGNFIIVNPSSIMYVSYIDGDFIFSAGYDYDLECPKDAAKTSFFCCFEKGVKNRFKELPKVADNIIDLLCHHYGKYHNRSPLLHKHFQSSINILSKIETDTIIDLDKTI